VDRKVEDTQEAFQNLLRWLHPEPEKAGTKYEEIRRRLIFVFRCRGCIFPDDLADQCIDRVARIISGEGFTYEGNPALFFYGVGKVIIKEHLRARPTVKQIPSTDFSEEKEHQHECLENCMSELSPRSRQLVLDYYGHSERAKTAHRKGLAEQLGITLNVLRIQTCRIRTVLRQCVLRCIESQVR
jgi:hypothetical protein